MAAIQVYKTDTFEIQRQKINEIGIAISGFSGGGNDFAAGNLKLGDGSIASPSLAFTSDNTLGLYKSSTGTFGFVSTDKKIIDFAETQITSYQDFVVQTKSLSNSQNRIDSFGTSYDAGSFVNVPLNGGTGSGATGNFIVTSYVGSITTEGEGYNPGNYFNIDLTGGNGSGAVVNITVDALEGEITNQGSGYAEGAYETITFTNVSGSGSGCVGDILVDSSGYVSLVIIRNTGSGYQFGDVLSANTADIGGTGSGFEFTITTYPDRIKAFTFVERGSGYQTGDVLSVDPVDIGNSSPSTTFEFTVSNVGEITTFNINNGGAGYFENDVLTIDPTFLTAPIGYSVSIPDLQEVTFVENVSSTYYSVGDTVVLDTGSGDFPSATVYAVNTSGSSLVSIIIDSLDLEGGEIIRFDEGDEIERTVDTVESYSRIVINGQLLRNLIFIPGETYEFNLEDPTNRDHVFAFSRFPGGIWGRGYVQNVSSVLDTTSTTISISDTSNIIEGMEVSVSSGTGSVVFGTRVVSIDSATDLTISRLPLISGPVQLNFRGYEYTTNVKRDAELLTIKVTADTPDLYYFDNTDDVAHENEGGLPNQEATIDVDQLNPRTIFGSGFQLTVAEVAGTDALRSDPSTGKLTAVSLETPDAVITQQNSNNITTEFLTATTSLISTINPIDEDININATNLTFNTDIFVSNKITISRASGDLTTAGTVKSGSGFNSNDFLLIDDNVISTSSGNNLVFTPAPQRVAKVNTTTALVVPVGDNNQRPQTGIVETGAIRYNTTTQQFEGFSNVSGTAAWSSLGGVRDVDGNTYILAEASTGINDNTFYFFNNDQNTLRLTTQYLDFRTTKKIRSENMSAPAYVNWSPNAFASVGDYIRYKTNVYQVISVTGSSQLAGSANPPTHDVGAEFNNEVELLWFTTAVDTITFEEVSAVQIDPNGTAPLIVNNELVLESSVIRSEVNDIIIRPFTGKKVEIFAKSSLVIPAGNVNDRGSAKIGSIRFNTDILQYEGYDGANWSSLGGVRDVDGNTYIIPELGAGTNENILYFYNDDINTLQLSASGLDFYSTDNITSSQSNVLNINVPTVAFNSSEFTIDNSGTSTVLTSSKETIDFNLSTGLTTENLISFTDEGDIIVNNSYSEGSVSNITVLDYQLKDFELSDMKTSTDDLALIRGTIDNRSTIVYDPSIHVSGKLSVIVENITKNERELIEFNICHKGSDIFYTEYGNISTNGELIATAFDFTAANEVRATFTLNTVNNNSGDTVNIVAIKTLIKK